MTPTKKALELPYGNFKRLFQMNET